ncbi:MAG TPA: hypothetical protein VK206_27250, partial [Anaerolineales bacterium]|nr:hypothetical protein [Anaerolineales bacterium]
LLLIGTLISWGIAALIRPRKREPSPFLSRLARWTSILLALLLMVILAGWSSLLITPDPVFDKPVIPFSRPPLFYALYRLRYTMSGLAG